MQISLNNGVTNGYATKGWNYYGSTTSLDVNFQYFEKSGRPPPASFYYHLSRLSLQANLIGEMMGLLKSAPRYMQINSIANAIQKMLSSYSKNLSYVANYFGSSYNLNGCWARNSGGCNSPNITIRC